MRRVLIDYAGLAQKSVAFVSSILGKKSVPKEEWDGVVTLDSK